MLLTTSWFTYPDCILASMSCLRQNSIGKKSFQWSQQLCLEEGSTVPFLQKSQGMTLPSPYSAPSALRPCSKFGVVMLCLPDMRQACCYNTKVLLTFRKSGVWAAFNSLLDSETGLVSLHQLLNLNAWTFGTSAKIIVNSMQLKEEKSTGWQQYPIHSTQHITKTPRRELGPKTEMTEDDS